MKRMVLVLAGIVLVCSTASLVIGWAVYQTMQRPPAFYEEALKVPSIESKMAGDRFEEAIFELSNQMRKHERWSTILSQTEINGWLVSDMPEKFPGVLPRVIAEPRIAIKDEFLELAFRVDSRQFNGIVHVQCSIFCTDQPNEIAVQVQRAASGIVAIPISFWAERIQKSLASKDIVLRWLEEEGDPIALISLPPAMMRHADRQFSIESIELSEGRVIVAGQSVLLPEEADCAAELPVDNHQN